ncbi:MAG: hypothetical protein KF678_04880 [Phycisphaeraceae bacterium]|nr:hypothetical protein [Phycisphaeraceae bacterium]
MKALLLIVAGAAVSAHAQPTIIARTNTVYPTLPPGTLLWAPFSDRSVHESGTVTFLCQLAGTSTRALVMIDPSGPRLLARAGDPAPGGLPGQVICQFISAQAIAGGASVLATVSDANGSCAQLTTAHLRFFATAAPQSIATVGQPLFGVQNTTVTQLAATRNHTESAAWVVTASTPSGATPSLWAGPPERPSRVATAGEPAPGLPGHTFAGFTANSLALSRTGHIAFRAMTSDAAAGIWASRPSGLSLLSSTPVPSPAHPGRLVHLGFSTSINTSGQVAIDGLLELPEGAGLARGLWLFSGGSLLPVAITGEPAPGTEGTFCSFGGNGPPDLFDLNEVGEVAFLSGICARSVDDVGLWAGIPGSLRLIARSGAPIPTLPPGSHFTGLDPNFAINARGQVAFTATFIHVAQSPARGIFIADRGRDPVLVVKTGDTLPGSTDTIAAFLVGSPYWSGGQDGRPTLFSDSGRLIFAAITLPSLDEVILRADIPDPCYANCDASFLPPFLTANDLLCFINRFASADPRANCDGSTTTPILTANDFACFLNAFAAGCP